MSAPKPSMSMFASTAEYWRHMAVRREAEIARLTAELAAARNESALCLGTLESRDQNIAELAGVNLRLAAEVEGLRADAERYHWLRDWLVRNGQLLCIECQPTAGAKVGPYWVFRRAYMVDGTSLEGYGKTEEEAIDAARQAG